MNKPAITNLDQIYATASNWARQTADLYQHAGRSLYEAEARIAHEVGVIAHHNIRLIETEQLPVPLDEELLALRIENGLLHSHTLGLTLGYQVLIKKGFITHHLLAHEFRHVYQFEQAGSLEKMIQNYLREVLQFGYKNAPMEMDAVRASRFFLK